MEGIYKAENDPVPAGGPEASEIEMDLGAQAKAESSTAGCWYEYSQSVRLSAIAVPLSMPL